MLQIDEKFPFYLARNDEHYWAHGKIIDKLADEFVEAQGIGMLSAECKRRYGIEDGCYIKNKNSKATPEIVAADEKQDKYFSFISQTITLSLKSPFEETQQAAKNLEFVLKPYKSAYRLSYLKESAQIKDFIKKLEEEENAADVETLGLTATVTALKEANVAFDELLETRSSEKRMKKVGDNMESIRPKVDEAFVIIAKAINTFYIMNEWGAKDTETRTRLETVINGINDILLELETALIRAGIIKKSGKTEAEGGDEPTPTPEPETPAITAVYQKEGGDPENPNRIERGEQTGVNYKGFTLKGQDGTLEHVIGLVNDQDYIEWIKAATISNVTETSFEFTMVPDLTEGQYKVRIETYDGGSPLVVEYPEPITLW